MQGAAAASGSEKREAIHPRIPAGTVFQPGTTVAISLSRGRLNHLKEDNQCINNKGKNRKTQQAVAVILVVEQQIHYNANEQQHKQFPDMKPACGKES